jgi:hypothetical protein
MSEPPLLRYELLYDCAESSASARWPYQLAISGLSHCPVRTQPSWCQNLGAASRFQQVGGSEIASAHFPGSLPHTRVNSR